MKITLYADISWCKKIFLFKIKNHASHFDEETMTQDLKQKMSRHEQIQSQFLTDLFKKKKTFLI